MFTYDFVLAVAVVAAPANDVPAATYQAWQASLHGPVSRFALASQIMDRREADMLLDPLGIAGDMKILQGRFRELCRAPGIEECGRFPDRRHIEECIAFNRAFRQDLCARMLLDPLHAEELRHAIQETDQLRQIWETLRDARSEYYYITVRRQSLQLCRHLIGMQAFYSGQLPPHVPIWCFGR